MSWISYEIDCLDTLLQKLPTCHKFTYCWKMKVLPNLCVSQYKGLFVLGNCSICCRKIPYWSDGIICHISNIWHLTAFVIYQQLLYMMQWCHVAYFACMLVWQVISVANLILILHDILWLDLLGGRKMLPLILVEFLTVQTVNMVNAWIVNGAVPQNSLFTRCHHLSH